jgi:uncharacterized protein YbbC (DUF1343 family)
MLIMKGQDICGIDQKDKYLPLLENKAVGLVCNHTSLRITGEHLVDYLLKKQIRVNTVFAPEHGFRGTASAGEEIKDGKDLKTGLPIISLYGRNKKPSPDMLAGIDVVVFDIQDVGARFYTYISTLSLVMEACAEQGIPVIVLDRPNPNGYYVDGPLLKPGYDSFVGMHPVPVVHGMTVGEYAQMVNGEGWLSKGVQCELTVIKAVGYEHSMASSLPMAPSPNLPNATAIRLYPSLCFFEGTNVSVGRGTDKPFQQIGAPWMAAAFPEYTFTPAPNEGATQPRYNGETCYGVDLTSFGNSFLPTYKGIYLYWLLEAYRMAPDKSAFFNPYFNKLAGSEVLRKQIEAGLSEEEIKASWQADLHAFKLVRKKYLLYPDFE